MDIIIKDRVQGITSQENNGNALGYVSASNTGFSTAGATDDFSDHLWISQSNDNKGFADGSFTGDNSSNGYSINARYVESGITYTRDQLKVNLFAHATALFLGNITADAGNYVQFTSQNIKGNPRHIQTDTTASNYKEATLSGQFASVADSNKVSRSIPVTTGEQTISHLTKDQIVLPIKTDEYNITNVSGVTNTSITYTIGNHDIVVGDKITVIGVLKGSGVELNLPEETAVTAVSATTVTVALASGSVAGDADPSSGKLLNKNPQGQRADYFQASSVADTTYNIGTSDNIAKSGTNYTFTVGTHDYQVGDFVEIKNINSNFNGVHKVTVIGGGNTTFTIVISSEPSIPTTITSATAHLYRIVGDEVATRTYTTTTTTGAYGASATNVNPARKGLYRTSISLRIFNALNRFVRGELTERTSTWANFPYNSQTSSLLITLRSYVNRKGQEITHFKKDTAGTTNPTGRFVDASNNPVSTENHGSIKVGSYIKITNGSTLKYYQVTKIIGDGTTSDSITLQKGHDGTSANMDLDTPQNYVVSQILNPISVGIVRSGFAKNFKNAKIGLGQNYKDYSFRRLLSNGSLQYQNRNVARIFQGSIMHDEESATELRLFAESQRAKPFAVLLLSNMNLENKVSMYAYFPDLPTERFNTRKADYKETSFRLQEVL